MRVVFNIEANGLNPTKIWCVVCKDVDTEQTYIFRNLLDEPDSLQSFLLFSSGVKLWIGHNILGYDLPVLERLLPNFNFDVNNCIDTLIVSKLVDYSRPSGHSTTSYAEEFEIDKPTQPSYSTYTEELVSYCSLLIEITYKIYTKYKKYLSNSNYKEAIRLEHSFQLVVNKLSSNGFSFNKTKAIKILTKVKEELLIIDKDILSAFPPKEVVVREFTPKLTKHGTISRTSVPRSLHTQLHEYEAGKTYTQTSLKEFNPSSHKQLIEVLNEAGWSPIEKTKTHVETERELNQLKRSRDRDESFDLKLKECDNKLLELQKTGWKINEENLATLPVNAPEPARLLARRILLESRRRTLTEWLGLLSESNRIHGKFYGLGAWTHRMAHQAPNTANIPNSVKVSDGTPVLYGKEMRSLWCAPKGRLLVGVDAEAIQLRVFAHLINDPRLTDAIVNGKKSDKTDPHSLNQQYFGSYCKTRNAAKHSLYAMFFGGGAGKIAEIMSCKVDEAKEAISSLITKYPGLQRLQKEQFPIDGRRGYFIGLDGRAVRIPGETDSYRRHLAMSGYLQNGESVVMKLATLKWHDKLKDYDAKLVNFVHDEWQTECPNDMKIAIEIAKMQADSLREVGEDLKLNCPLAGSYWNDDLNDYTIATNWAYTH